MLLYFILHYTIFAGNVTAFSRIQKFLESHKVINCNAIRKCDQRLKNSNQMITKRVPKPKRSYVDNQMAKLGTTADEVMEESVKLPSRTRPNPFKLVPLEIYESESEVNFKKLIIITFNL